MCAPEWRAHSAADARIQSDAVGRLDPTDVRWRERELEAVFGLAHYPEHCAEPRLERELANNPGTLRKLAELLQKHADTPGPTLEIGCGPGRLLHELAAVGLASLIGLDLRIGLLRIARQLRDDALVHLPSRTLGALFEPIVLSAPAAPRDRSAQYELVQANLYRPPFADGTFAAILACSVLDVVPDPDAALVTMERLLAPGGLLLIAAPWQWQASSTAPERWWSAPATVVEQYLTSRGHVVIERFDELTWAIPGHARLVHRYFLQGLLTRKPRSPARNPSSAA